MQLSPNFSLSELTVTTTGLPNVPNDEQLVRLIRTAKQMELVRTAVDNKPIEIAPDHSAFRTLEVNTKVRGSKTSGHMLGDCVDFVVSGMTNKQICAAIIKAGIKFDQLIDECRDGKQWVHIGFGKAMRQQYLIFSNGKYEVHK